MEPNSESLFKRIVSFLAIIRAKSVFLLGDGLKRYLAIIRLNVHLFSPRFPEKNTVKGHGFPGLTKPSKETKGNHP